MTRRPIPDPDGGILPSTPAPSATRALVIGDPATGRRDLATLPAARQEAKRVVELLSDTLLNHDVRVCIAQDEYTTLAALFEAPLRVLHIASHSDLAPAVDSTPYALGDDLGSRVRILLGRAEYFGEREFAAFERMPELVFLGVHHGASLAPALLRLGVRVVIAPVGSIDDEGSARFAIAFYEALTRGDALIDAVREARRQCWEAFPSNDVWGRFQCHGDAHWRLVQPARPLTEGAAAEPASTPSIKTHARYRSTNV